ncbi:response regulator transcription factor [Geothermobacter hydrogeniphilus]|uniref:Response regulatory domain-containing protein n=1 Tax=Geothermobacter hydrogeniphilus TaxID=1969733 RepID=A0A1X0YCF2_9BACT|nr:response regulator [Geothermobacter hydrogeniphilus]ORJ62891.1 hypothetical protein B5V00_02205 [Geothermobacter hydrogeniphilus]
MQQTILVVEDEPAVRELEANALTRLGYQVLQAASAEEGYGLAKQRQPDLIILDVMFQGKDGFALARKLHSLDETRHIPIIFVTARDQPDDMARGFAAGGKIYLTKPFTEKNLETAVRSLLPSGE